MKTLGYAFLAILLIILLYFIISPFFFKRIGEKEGLPKYVQSKFFYINIGGRCYAIPNNYVVGASSPVDYKVDMSKNNKCTNKAQIVMLAANFSKQGVQFVDGYLWINSDFRIMINNMGWLSKKELIINTLKNINQDENQIPVLPSIIHEVSNLDGQGQYYRHIYFPENYPNGKAYQSDIFWQLNEEDFYVAHCKNTYDFFQNPDRKPMAMSNEQICKIITIFNDKIIRINTNRHPRGKYNKYFPIIVSSVKKNLDVLNVQ